MLKAVIMAGGAGTRFWPLSRRAMPKHLLTVIQGRPLVAEAVDRAATRLAPADIFIITTPEQVRGITQACPSLPRQNIIAEPVGRNTAACIGYAAVRLLKSDPDCTMLVMPADHLITPVDAFWNSVDAGVPLTRQIGNLVTFGITPDAPSTGYGYIHRGATVSEHQGTAVYRLKEFKEKPDLATAQEYLQSGEYYWNSGIFLWSARTILEEIRRLMPEHGKLLDHITQALGTPDESRTVNELYPRFPCVSIDFGVMEKAKNVFVVQTRYAWDDVGSWLSMTRHRAPDSTGSVVSGDHVAVDSSDCIVVSGQGHLVGTVGVEGLIIVHTPDATLVARKDRAEDVKKLVEELRKLGREDLL